MFKMQTEVSRLRHDVDRLGTARDTVDLRQRIGAANQRVTTMAKDIKEQLLTLGNNDTKQTAKLTNDFEVLHVYQRWSDTLLCASCHVPDCIPHCTTSHTQLFFKKALLKDFSAMMKAARAKEAASLPRAPPPEPSGPSASSDDVETRALLQQRQQQELKQVDAQIDYNAALIEERDQGIQEIQQQIAEVGEIFQDLAVLVHDQGGMLEDIEANITTTAHRAKEAGQEIVKADRYQRRARNRRCYIMLIAGVVLGILLLVLFTN